MSIASITRPRLHGEDAAPRLVLHSEPLESSASEGRWVRPAFVLLLVLTAVAYLWDLSASGYANSFYAAAVEAGTKSWKAFLFGSLDSSNFITVDKPPASLWVMELSGRLFGFSSWSLLAPQALEGVAAVALLYGAVKRWFGARAGLLAGAVLAITPVAALMFRFDNPDALMVLLLVASAYSVVRALERASTRWIVAAGVFLGFAFLAKMLEAFTVVPAFFAVYLIAAPASFWRRIRQLFIGGLALAVGAGWWVLMVELWPAGSRPFIDGSPDNSIFNLIFDYNGFGRLVSGSSGGQGGNFSGSTGVFRLFNDLMGGQASWLLPAALFVLVAGLVWRFRAPRTDQFRAAIMLWGGWLIVTGAVFSFGQGIIHTYYTVALAPAIAALVGVGAGALWKHRHQLQARLLGAVGIAITAGWAYELMDRTPTYYPWLRVAILATGALAVLALLAAPFVARMGRRLNGAAAGMALVACLGGPLSFTRTTVTTAHTGSIPSAGPSSGVGAGFGGGNRGAGGAPAGFGGASRDGVALRSPSGFGVGGKVRSGGRPSSTTGAGGFGGMGKPGGALGGGTRGGPGGGAGFGGGAAQVTTNSALVKALETDASSYRWVAATFGSQNAASIELASKGEPVMAIGGFNGNGGNISLAQFEAYVAKDEIHYFISSGGGGGGTSSDESTITAWVESHYSATTIGGETVYDLTTSKK